jgi:hypothetical protein
LNEALLRYGSDAVDGLPVCLKGNAGSNGCAIPGCELLGGHQGVHQGPDGKFFFMTHMRARSSRQKKPNLGMMLRMMMMGLMPVLRLQTSYSQILFMLHLLILLNLPLTKLSLPWNFLLKLMPTNGWQRIASIGKPRFGCLARWLKRAKGCSGKS